MIQHTKKLWWRVFVRFVAAAMSMGISANALAGDSWPMSGLTIENTRSQSNESKIDANTVGDLTVKWATQLGGDVSATPAVEGDFVYVPDWGGNLNKINRDTGELIWQRSLSEYTDIPNNFARTTPAIYKDLLIFGDQGGRFFGGAKLIAVNKDTGNLEWVTQLDDHFAAIITQSATIHQDVVYVGAASLEEAFAAFIPNYICCSFKGSMAAVDANTGAIKWKTYTVPEGFSGNAVWGSSPSIDTNRKQVYIATGNNYSAPPEFLNCITAAGDDETAQRACLPAENYFDAVLALDMDTGDVNWSNVVIPFDVWTVSCLFGQPTCPSPAGPDFDFGQAPMLMKVKTGSQKKTTDLVGVGQKSGIFWALDADTGNVVWSTQVSPGGVAGGIQWGSAFDGERIYTSSANSEYKPWTLPDGSTSNYGIWSALDPATGEIVWQTSNPSSDRAGGAVSVANGVVYACSLDPMGYMYAMDAATGNTEWSFASGGSCNSGAAIAQGTVFWGSGYGSVGLNPADTPNNIFRAYSLPD
jgi:polyvinyl alcohol dehydrogenase (cytochrome)